MVLIEKALSAIDNSLVYLGLLKEQESEKDEPDETVIEDLSTAISILRDKKTCILNPILSIEELKEMVGKPVYLVTGAIGRNGKGSYEIFTGFEGSVFLFTSHALGFVEEEYGKTWACHRHGGGEVEDE